MDFLKQLFGSGDFQPHGFCYLCNARLVWLHAISDLLIALAYLTIPITLVWFIRKQRDLPFSWIFVCFGAFIVACGATHVMEIWNLWHANYWLAGVIKAVTAAASIATAILLIRLVPQALDLPARSNGSLPMPRFRRKYKTAASSSSISASVSQCTAKRPNSSNSLTTQFSSAASRKRFSIGIARPNGSTAGKKKKCTERLPTTFFIRSSQNPCPKFRRTYSKRATGKAS